MIRTLPVSINKTAELISLTTAEARYGIEITQPSNEVAKTFDTQIMDIIGGPNKSSLRCWETSIALLWQSHSIFIQTATPYQMMVTANRQIARHTSIERMFAQVWQQRTKQRKWKDRWVVAGIGRQIKTLKWEWKNPLDNTPNKNRPLSLACPLRGWFKHQAREAVRQIALVKPHHRKNMACIENGVK